MISFIFVAGSIASGKSIFIQKLYNQSDCNFYDLSKPKLMLQLYARPNDKSLSNALENAIAHSIEKQKDFIIEAHFSDEELNHIDQYFEKYRDHFDFRAHFLTVSNIEILKDRAKKMFLLGDHSWRIEQIEKSFNQSFKNFIEYLSKFEKATFWDNSKEFGFTNMEEQFVFENGKLTFENPNLTDYSKKLLNAIQTGL